MSRRPDRMQRLVRLRQFREEIGNTLGRSVHQLDWLRARAEEGALWEHMHRVHDHQYAEHRQWSRIFRVT